MLYYIIGILGSGTKALAELLIKMGHTVKGCDVKDAILSYKGSLQVEDINCFEVDFNQTYIIGNSFIDSYQAKMLKSLGAKWITYPKMIDELNFKTKIQVSASHGKTFTTALTSHILASSALIGDGTARYVNDIEFVYEGCEYKNSFLNYHPDILVLLNVDYDHVDFFKTKREYEEAFIKMAKLSKTVIYNLDDSNLANLQHPNSYSFSMINDKATLYGHITEKKENGYMVRLKYFSKDHIVFIPFYAKHNIYNFLASFLVGLILGRNEEEMLERVKSFKLPSRRLNETIINGNILINDYAHHPTQIESLKEYIDSKYPDYKKVIIYEGHTLSRSLYFKQEYKNALNQFDRVYLYPIYYAREQKSKKEKEYYNFLGFSKYDSKKIKNIIKGKNSVIVFAGAGVIYQEYDKLLKEI